MTTEKSKDETKKMIAIVRVRGDVNLRAVVKTTLESLNLHAKNWCVFFPDSPSLRGMLAHVKDFVTWGEVSPEVMAEIVSKRGEEYKGRLTDSKEIITYEKYFEHDGKKFNRYFRMNSPARGMGQEGIKTPFASNGALGDRKEKINDLLKRMI